MTENPMNKVINAFKKLPAENDFAVVVSLTQTAKLIQKEIKEKELPGNFELKNRWTQSGVRTESATKTKMEAKIFMLERDYLTVHDDGGKKKIGEKTNEFWIPGKGFEIMTGINPRKKIIPKKFKRGEIFKKDFPILAKNPKSRKKAKAFRAKSKSGDEMIAVRSTSDSYPLQVLYIIVKQSISIRRRLFFKVPSENIYNKKFMELYDKNYEKYVKL